MTQSIKFYGWTLLVVFWLILIADYAFPFFGASVISPYMAKDLHLSRSSLGTAFAVLSWMAGLPAPLVAMCINNKGVRFTILLGSAILLAGSLAMALLVRGPLGLTIAFGVVIGAGLITAGVIPPMTGSAAWFTKRRALVISLLTTGPGIGGFIAPVVLDHLITVNHGNWRVAWWLIAGLNVIAILLAYFFVKERPSDIGQFPDGEAGPVTDGDSTQPEKKRGVYRTSEDWTFSEVLRSPTLWLMLAACVGVWAGFTMFLAHGVIHLIDLGHAPAEAAFSLSILLIAVLGGNFLVAGLGDRIELRYLFGLGSFLLGVGILLAVNATGAAGLYLYAIALGGGFGMAFSAVMTLPSNYFGYKAYASVLGITSPVQTTAGAVAALVAGYAYDHFGHSYAATFYTVTALCFLGAIIALFLTPPVRKTAQR